MKKTIKDIYDSHNNLFTIMSIIMSIMIIVFHCYALFYNNGKTDFLSNLLEYENTGSIVVAMFFIISGFMIPTSLKNSKNLGNYLWKRVKKIIPPLFLCLVVSSMVIAPLVLKVNYFSYLFHPGNYFHYIFDNLLFVKNTNYGISNAFINNPYPIAINGSIWTLKHQFFMYLLIIPIFYLLVKDDKKYYYIFYLLILFITILSYTGSLDNIYKYFTNHFSYIGILNEGKALIRLSYYFLAGVFINKYIDKIPYTKFSIIIMILPLIIFFKTEYFPYACLVSLPYLTIVLGTIKCPIKITDISYHIYIWAFPIQQLIIYYGLKNLNIYNYIILSIFATIIVAYISYYLSEYPFKKRR